MKKLIGFAVAICSYCLAMGQAAEKNDVVFKMNGDQLKGQVVEVNDDQVRFKYSGEQVIYTFKKSDIQKINFASGRTETYHNNTSSNSRSTTPVPNSVPATPATAPASSKEDRRNKVAILPFSFVKDGLDLPQAASDEIQNECYTRFSEHPGTYMIVNPRTTNVILAKAGIDKTNILKYTMTEICQMLGVEYIVDGIINQNTTAQSTSGNKSYDFKKDYNKKSNNNKISGSSSYSSNVSQEYETVTTINIYNDKSENIFSQRRKALFSTVGAYKNTIAYLLRRSPLYSK